VQAGSTPREGRYVRTIPRDETMALLEGKYVASSNASGASWFPCWYF
jgi:hypothetical protein